MRYLFSLLILIPFSLFSQEDLPFQVLVAKNASIYGKEVQPLQFVDDVTSIDINGEGFLSLVHKGGTTYELREKIFTFYLKPEQLKERNKRPNLNALYSDSLDLDKSRLIGVLNPTIEVLHPIFDNSNFLVWNEDEPFEFFWHLHEEPVLVYVLTVSDGDGNKIQDFRTKHHQFTLKPTTFGLEKNLLMFQLSSTFAGETVKSKRYQIQLEKAPIYEKKASDLVIKALDLELSPILALDAWKEALSMPYGKYYIDLFSLFLTRNGDKLNAAGEDVELLLSQNK